MIVAPTEFFDYQSYKLAYRIYGGGPRTIILIHGLLLNQKMHEPLALSLAARGERVITLDVLGHGESSRPKDMTRYSMSEFAIQTVALMDHLGIDRAVVGGTSLGANISLEVASLAPERLAGMLIEMPVLDDALMAAAIAFTPAMVAMAFAEPIMQVVSAITKRIPRRILPHLGNIILDTVRQDPGPSGAVIQGIFFGRIAPHSTERRTFDAPTLIIGHGRDPVHAFSDSGKLAKELPNARLVEADSILEMRLNPVRLTGEIGDFIDHCWKPVEAKKSAGGKKAAA